MYNFKMSKKKQQDILNKCNFNEVELLIFNSLVEEKTRKETYKIVKEKFGLSQPTVDNYIPKIFHKINECDSEDNLITHKVYIHKFPNGKKYVGVCISCEDRWQNGNGYGYNKKMFADIKKYGWENIEHKILFETGNSELAFKLEQILIEELNLINDGYNEKIK